MYGSLKDIGSEIVSKRGLPEVPRVSGLVLVTSQFGLEYAQNVPPYVKMIGPAISTSRQDLNPRLDEVLEDALKRDKTVIYLSLGTVVSVPAHSVEQLVKGLERLNDSFVVVWSLREHQQASVTVDIPQNIIVFTEQLPQISLLSHPSVKLFISHCGANSLIEALFFGVPVLGIPVRTDQFGNAAMAVSLETGESLDITTMDETSVFEMVLKMLQSPKYRLAAEKISTILQETRGLETGAREIEFLASIKDISPFIPLSYNLPWYVSTHVDIYLFAGLLLFTSLKLLVMCYRCTSKKVCFNCVKAKID